MERPERSIREEAERRRTADARGGDQPHLDAALTGPLPCVVCRYNLQGLSIRAVCPECGTAVRATILYRIDPEAEEFQPLVTPRLTAIGIVLWATSGFLALLASWEPRLVEVIHDFADVRFDLGLPDALPLALGALSAIGLLGAVCVTREIHWRRCLGAVAAILAYLPLLYAMMQVKRIDQAYPTPYFFASPQSLLPERIHWRLLIGASLIVILLGFRPHARELVRRSLAMRTGRVDRQTLLAMVTAVLIAGVGDGLRLLAAHGLFAETLLANLGALLVAVGSAFLTIGMFSAIIDGVRIAGVLISPGPTMADVLGDGAGDRKSA